MSLELPFGVRTLTQEPEISKYFNQAGTPYTNTTQVLSEIPSGIRHVGLTVNISGIEYWFNNGILDTDLVIKSIETDIKEINYIIEPQAGEYGQNYFQKNKLIQYINNNPSLFPLRTPNIYSFTIRQPEVINQNNYAALSNSPNVRIGSLWYLMGEHISSWAQSNFLTSQFEDNLNWNQFSIADWRLVLNIPPVIRGSIISPKAYLSNTGLFTPPNFDTEIYNMTGGEAIPFIDFSSLLWVRTLELNKITKITSINLAGCTNLSKFIISNCKNLTSIDLSNSFNTAIISDVVNMDNVFKIFNCPNLINLNLAGVEANNVYDIDNLLYNWIYSYDNITSLLSPPPAIGGTLTLSSLYEFEVISAVDDLITNYSWTVNYI
jgi:hypothetical protein